MTPAPSTTTSPDTTPLPAKLPALKPQCIVPKLVGDTLSAATERLKAAHCALGKVTKPTVRKGHKAPHLVVASERPKAGSKLKNGSAVRLVMNAKPRPKKHGSR